MRIPIAALALTLLGGGAGAQPGTTMSASDLEGVWKKCYEPGLSGVDEPDSGFLVLMPEAKYYEVSSSCCSGSPSSAENHFDVSGTVVTLTATRQDGAPYRIDLHYHPSAQVVFFDDLRGKPVTRPALAHGDDLNYAWCKVFPLPDPS